ncbi:MAG: DUF2093 domain-containing protein [Hyphomonadaceae bacterium]
MLQRSTPASGEAVLRYSDFDYTIVKPGAFVRCAVSGVEIPLEALRYWNADRQEAYRSAEEAVARWRQLTQG